MVIIAHMKKAFFRRGISAVCAGIFCASSAPAWGKSAKEVFAEVARSVVVVLALDSSGDTSAQGSGVVVGKNQVATNCHVIDKAKKIVVRQALESDIGQSYQMDAAILAQDDERDLCLLFVGELSEPPAAPIVKMGAAKALSIGEEIFAIGAPKGLDLSLSRGIVSQLRRLDDRQTAPFVQTDAAISPGSSGGGLFNDEGLLVGITTFKRVGGENLNFAIPTEWIEDLQKKGQAELAVKELRWAVGNNELKEVARLLETGTDVNGKTQKIGATPLHWAAYKNVPEIAKLLIDKGAEVNAKTKQRGATPLHAAAMSNASDIAALLLEKGAEVNAKDEKAGETPLHVAAYKNSPEVADMLLEKGANVNSTGDSGWTPMDVAIHKNHSKIQSLLMRHGGKCAKKC